MRLALGFLAAFVSSLASAAPPTPHVGITIPLTRRSNITDERGVVSIKALKSQINKISSKMERGFQAYQRNTGFSHPSKIKGTNKRATGSDSLTDDGDALWHGTISVGTPPVEFTGSSDLFLPGKDCTANCEGHKVYDTDASSTAQDLGRRFSLGFGDGSSVQGEQFSDTVTIAGLTATGQAVGAATQYSTGFSLEQFPPDGLMGMGFKEISEFGADPVFQTLVAEGATSVPEFAFKLASSGSELFLGGVDSQAFVNDFTQVPVTTVGFWQVDLDGVGLGGNLVGQGLSAVIDTGTSLVLGDAQSVSALYSQIAGAKDASQTVGDGFFTVPCASIPTVSLTFGGKAFSISPDTFNLGQLSQGSADCVGGIASPDLGTNFWIVGDVFLRNVYTSFNFRNERVGFADLA